jgi:hypothetical protein
MSLSRRTVPSGILVDKTYSFKTNRIASPIFPAVSSVIKIWTMSHMTKISYTTSLWTTWSSSSLKWWYICTMRQCFLLTGAMFKIFSLNLLMTRPTCGGTGIKFLSKMLIWLFLNKKSNTRSSGSIASTTKSIFKRKVSKINRSTSRLKTLMKISKGSGGRRNMRDSLRPKRLSICRNATSGILTRKYSVCCARGWPRSLLSCQTILIQIIPSTLKW